jgi:hypothetical protein
MNSFESVDFDIWEQQDEVVVEEKYIVVFTYNQDLEFVDDIMDEEETEKFNKFCMH